MIVGYDWGNSETKIMCSLGLAKFPSAIGEYQERNLENTHGMYDMVFEYEGRRGFAGTLAQESDFGGSIMGESKAHEDALIRLLLGLHRCGDCEEYQVVVGQPISMHMPAEKNAIKAMVIGKHTITVNEITRTFIVRNCEIAAEGGAAFWSAPVSGKVRIIDIGSATVNCATLVDKRYLNKDSFTLPFGMETIKTDDLDELARGIYSHTSKRWKKVDDVYLVGGAAESVEAAIKRHYPNAQVMNPVIKENGAETIVNPIFANAVAFYNIGRGIYEENKNKKRSI
ncbi:ParM/StbA family protein [Salipaludibacillus sp. CF4.18]|uniref:ParM/StbA family protein n=1 Tax=Salipaludibacillus sp. CF4.18 TaxID=3373081 RepID=UPI003EE58A78